MHDLHISSYVIAKGTLPTGQYLDATSLVCALGTWFGQLA